MALLGHLVMSTCFAQKPSTEFITQALQLVIFGAFDCYVQACCMKLQEPMLLVCAQPSPQLETPSITILPWLAELRIHLICLQRESTAHLALNHPASILGALLGVEMPSLKVQTLVMGLFWRFPVPIW